MSDNDPTLADLAQRFADPPRDFSPVPIWWWSGERLEPARLRWQREQFVAGRVFNLVIMNLAPTGPLAGSDTDDPIFFSEAWWVLFPTTTVQAHTTPDGPLPPAHVAHDTYLELVGRMIWYQTRLGVLDRDRRDYDVLDDDSLQRAEIQEGALAIGAERYRAIVLPGCVTLAPATAAVLCRFVESGGALHRQRAGVRTMHIAEVLAQTG
jgi:hypothetical protein